MIDEREGAIEDAVRQLYEQGSRRLAARSVKAMLIKSSDIKAPNAGVIGNYLDQNRDLGFAEVVEVEKRNSDSNLYILE